MKYPFHADQKDANTSITSWSCLLFRDVGDQFNIVLVDADKIINMDTTKDILIFILSLQTVYLDNKRYTVSRGDYKENTRFISANDHPKKGKYVWLRHQDDGVLKEWMIVLIL